MSIDTRVTRQELERRLRAALKQLSKRRPPSAKSSFDAWERSWKLSKALGIPELDREFAGNSYSPTKLIVVSQDIVSQVPFGTLPTQPVSAAELPSTLSQRYNLSMTLTADWSMTAETCSFDELQPAIGIAVTKTSLADSNSEPLNTACEIATQVLNNARNSHTTKLPETLYDSDATIKKVETGLQRAGMVFTCCHGKYSPDPTSSSGLLLYDGWLPPSRIRKLNLTGLRCVMLSSCWGHSGGNPRDPDALSLSEAFISAGADWVIAGLWQHPLDESAVFFESITQVISSSGPDGALAYAQLEGLKNDMATEAWAGFVAARRGIQPSSFGYWLIRIASFLKL